MNVSALTPVAAPSGPFTAAGLRNAAPDEQRRQVAAQFEAILVRQLLSKTMTSMLGSDASGPAAGVYGDMLTNTFATQLTAGPGLGLGRLLEKQLTPRGLPTIAASPSANSAPAMPAPDRQ